MIKGLEESLGFDGGVAQKRIDGFAKEEKGRRVEVLPTASVVCPCAQSDLDRTNKREQHRLQIESRAIFRYTINDPL